MPDHGEDADDPVEEQYGHSHQVSLVPGSWFADLMGLPAIPVNSLHGQGIKTLAKGLEPQEAVRVAKAWLAEAVRSSGQLSVGSGHGPVHHFHALWQD